MECGTLLLDWLAVVTTAVSLPVGIDVFFQCTASYRYANQKYIRKIIYVNNPDKKHTPRDPELDLITIKMCLHGFLLKTI